MLLEVETYQAMSQLASYCQTGEGDPPPGVDPERAAVYRRLVFSGICDTLERGYPVAYHLLQGERWDHLVQTFFAKRRVATPYLWQVPREFRDYVKQERFGEQWTLPYLDDLLQFEWLEIGVHMMPNGNVPPVRVDGEVMQDSLVVNPDHSLDILRYPVFSGSVDEWLAKPGTYFLLTYRDRTDFVVHYSHLSPLSAIVFELLRQQPLSGEEIVDWLVANQGQEREEMEQFCGVFLQELLLNRVVVGFLME